MKIALLASALLSTAAVAAPATTWDVDAGHTSAGFGVRHMMVSTTRGQFTKVKGSAQIDDADPSKSTVEVVIDAASIDTRDAKRDAHLKSADFFDAAKYPSLTFKSTKIEPGPDGKLLATGNLTIKGVTKPVTLTVELTPPQKSPFGTTVRGASATGKLSRKEYGLTWNAALESGGVAVGDEVQLTIDAELVQRPVKTAQR